ncbi:MAG: dihydrolipoyl dehydrogenase [Clostridia bacterium]|nr:dihydrolipoyl dehydrogenase [Clostridia bacterium]
MEKTSSNDYDVVVIGGGPGGYVAAIKAAQSGLRTAIVEKEYIGGTCLNIGCIPTKTLLRSVESLKEVKKAGDFGVVGFDSTNAHLDMEKVQQRKEQVISKLVGGVKALLVYNGVTVINGEGRIENKNSISLSDTKITADNIIIATGSIAKQLPIPVSPKMEVLTSTEVLNITEIPESIAIIGGGVVGIEFAYFLANIGAKVTVIEYLDRILPMVDEEITALVTNQLSSIGISIYTSAKVLEVTEDGVKFEKDGKEEIAVANKVLMAVGRTPNTSGIDCEGLGIRTEHGAIVTDETLRTSVDNIFAIGDVNGKAMLAHAASAEGIIAVENICGRISTMDYNKVPSAIYLQPEIACVGLTEAQAKEKYGDVKVGKFPLWANGKAEVVGESGGLVKVIADAKCGEILGVHIYAEHATDIIAESVVAMKLEGTAEKVAMSIHPNPTFSEALNEAMHAVDGHAIHLI